MKARQGYRYTIVNIPIDTQPFTVKIKVILRIVCVQLYIPPTLTLNKYYRYTCSQLALTNFLC